MAGGDTFFYSGLGAAVGLGVAGLALRHFACRRKPGGALRRKWAGGSGRDNEVVKRQVFGHRQPDSRAAKDRILVKNPLRTGR